jgi:hypothetical protein
MLTCIVTNLKNQKPHFAYYKLQEYKDFKVENDLCNLHCEMLGVQTSELA